MCANGEERHYYEADVCSKCETVIIHMWALLFHNSLNTSVSRYYRPFRIWNIHTHKSLIHHVGSYYMKSSSKIIATPYRSIFNFTFCHQHKYNSRSKVMSVSIRFRHKYNNGFILKHLSEIPLDIVRHIRIFQLRTLFFFQQLMAKFFFTCPKRENAQTNQKLTKGNITLFYIRQILWLV